MLSTANSSTSVPWAQVVKGGDKLDLGKGHELEFVMAPNLHWPGEFGSV